MRTQKIVVMAILTLAFALGATVMPAMASGDLDKESTGSFSMNNAAPTVTNVDLYNTGHSEAVGTFTAVVPWAVKMTIGDTNTLNNLHNITVTLRTNLTAQDAADSLAYKATYQWNHANGWTKTGPSAAGWAIGACDVPTLSGTSGDFWLDFTPGPLANESVTGCCNWMIYVVAVDNGSLSANSDKTGLTMQWYGDITAPGAFSFGNVAVTETEQPMESNSINIDAIANGYYQLTSGSTAVWSETTSGHGYTVALDTDGSDLGSGAFALKNNDSSTYATGNFVGTTNATIHGYSYVTPPTTDEAGNDNSVYLWIDLATTGIMPYVYSGTYYVQIANDN